MLLACSRNHRRGGLLLSRNDLLQWSLNKIQNKYSGHKEKCISEREIWEEKW
jgi:hypothetical protein